MSRRATDPIPVIPGFRIEEEIGRGTSARVFRARQENLNRTVALKVITTLGEEGNRRALRLFREASLTGALDHPGIVRAIDAGDRDDFCWFAMELVEGRTLQDDLEEGGPWPWRRAIGLGLEVLDALEHAHLRGVVHRDLKPSNILVDSEGHARILDLGLARREADPRLTHEGGTVGTPRFMAPEQALDPAKVDGRADLFALGAVLYRTMSGIGPFDGETVAAVLTRLLYDEPTPLSMLQPDLPEAISLVIGKILEKNPDHRFQDARAFADALREAARGVRPRSVRTPTRPRTWIAAGSAAAVLLAAVILFFVFRPKEPTAPWSPGTGTTQPAPPPARVREFVFPNRPDLSPLDRARLALEAWETDASPAKGGELAAALMPLREDLVAAATQHKSAARQILLSTGVEQARVTMSHLKDRLRSDVSPEDDAPLHPVLERLVEEVSRDTTEAFDKDLAAEQKDAALDIVSELEALLTRPDARRWTLGEQSAKVSDVLGSRLHSLDRGFRDTVETKRKEVLTKLAAIPVEENKATLDRARSLIRDGHFRAARDLISSLTATAAEGSAPGALVEAQPLLTAIEVGENKLIAEAEAAVERVSRGEAAALDSAGRTRRATDLASTVGILAQSKDDVPQIAEPLAFAGKVSQIATEAAALRERALERLGSGVADTTSIDWKLRRKGSIGPRQLTRREGSKIVVRRDDGAREAWEIEEIAARTIADAQKAGGVAVNPLSIALLEHWDGEDDLAQSHLRALPDDLVRDWLLGVVSAAIESAASSYATEVEREAFPIFLQARRKFSEHAYARALELVDQILSQKRLTGSAFLRKHQAELENIAAQSRQQVQRAARMRPFGPAAEIQDEKAGVVRLLWTFDEKTPLEGLLLPPGYALEARGLKWPGVAGARAALPEQSPALRMTFPEGTPASPTTIELELVRSPEPVPFVGLSYAGITLLVLGDLKQSNAFAGVPLHGIERELVQIQSIQKAICIAGSFVEARRGLMLLGKPAALNRGDSTVIRLRIDSEHAELSGMVGNERIPLVGDRKPLEEPPALDLRLPPGVVLRSLLVDLPLVPKKPG